MANAITTGGGSLEQAMFINLLSVSAPRADAGSSPRCSSIKRYINEKPVGGK